MKDEMLYHFGRGKNESVHMTLREYKQRRYIDLRIFFKPKDGNEMLPTKKGIMLGLDLLPELKRGVNICEKKLAEEAN
ncbi:MAG: transcriptional coactivator p15/PC4 family protein [Candidatus Omnitrophica bacterium]|nr:transcriptional coactivator p15/PC4 family protein [Candidatus Omnitrophota bacterium]